MDIANDFARNLWAEDDESSFGNFNVSYLEKSIAVVDEEEEDDGKFDFFPAPEASDNSNVPAFEVVSHSETLVEEERLPINGHRVLYRIDEQGEDDAFEASFVRMVDDMRHALEDDNCEDDSTEDILLDLSFVEEKADTRARRNGMFLQYGYF